MCKICIGKNSNTPEIYKKTQNKVWKNGKRFFCGNRMTQKYKDIYSFYINI